MSTESREKILEYLELNSEVAKFFNHFSSVAAEDTSKERFFKSFKGDIVKALTLSGVKVSVLPDWADALVSEHSVEDILLLVQAGEKKQDPFTKFINQTLSKFLNPLLTAIIDMDFELLPRDSAERLAAEKALVLFCLYLHC